MEKTVLVTGSAKGIGSSLIRVYAKEGYNVVINYLNSEYLAKDLEKEIKEKYKVKVLCLKADITDENSIKEMLKTIIKEFSSIDILINNAALALDNSYLNKSKEEFMQVLETNVVGPFLMIKYASQYMKKNSVILNVSSTDAVDTYSELNIDYSASKAALNNLTKTYALILKDIKVLGVMLPWVNTESIEEMNQEYLKKELLRTNQKRLLESREVAQKIQKIIADEKNKSGSIIKVGVE